MLQDYLRELSRVSLLEPDHEQNLWCAYKEQHDGDSRRILIESYQPLVFKIALQLHLHSSILMDGVQEGTVGLIEAVENYDHRKGVAFSLYAQHRIRGRIINYLQQEGKKTHISLEQPLVDDGVERGAIIDTLVDATVDIAASLCDQDLAGHVQQALFRLPMNEQVVLSGVYLQEQEPKDVAVQMDVSLSHVYRLQKQGIRRLRGMFSRVMSELKK